jgi:hypothetical protein
VNLATFAGTAAYNGAVVEVDVSGSVVIDSCVFSLNGSSFTLDYVNVGSPATNIMSASPMTFPTNNEGLFNFAQRVMVNINAAAGTYKAFSPTQTNAVYLFNTAVKSSDSQQQVQVSITGTGSSSGGTGGVISASIVPTTQTDKFGGIITAQTGPLYPLSNGWLAWEVMTKPVTATVTGGVPPYTFLWSMESFYYYVVSGQLIQQNSPISAAKLNAFVIDSGWWPGSYNSSLAYPTPLPPSTGNATSSSASIFIDWGGLGKYLGGVLVAAWSVQVTDSTGAVGVAGPVLSYL